MAITPVGRERQGDTAPSTPRQAGRSGRCWLGLLLPTGSKQTPDNGLAPLASLRSRAFLLARSARTPALSRFFIGLAPLALLRSRAFLLGSLRSHSCALALFYWARSARPPAYGLPTSSQEKERLTTTGAPPPPYPRASLWSGLPPCMFRFGLSLRPRRYRLRSVSLALSRSVSSCAEVVGAGASRYRAAFKAGSAALIRFLSAFF